MRPTIFFFVFCFFITFSLNARDYQYCMQKAKELVNTNLDSAYYFSNMALIGAQKRHDDAGEMEALLLKHRLSYYKGLPDTARYVLDCLHTKLAALDNDSIQQFYHAKIASMESGLYMDGGKYREADSCLVITTRLAEAGGYSDVLMMAKVNHGLVCRAQGNLSDAFECYNRALNISDSIGHYDMKFSILNMIGQILIEVGEPDEGIAYLEQAGDIKDSASYVGYVAEWIANLGYAWFNKKELDRSLDYYLQSRDLALDNSMPFYEALAVTNLGEIYLCKGLLNESFKNLQRGLLLFDQLQSMYGKFYATSLMGGYYFEMKQYEEADQCFREAETMMKQVDVIVELKKRHYERKYSLYKAIGKSKEALLSFEQFKIAESAVNNKEVKWKVGRLERNLQLAEKQKIIDVQKQELERQNYQVQLYKSRSWIVMLLGLVMLVVFVAFVLFMRLKQKKDKAVYRAEIDKVIVGYKLRNIQTQLSPHFIFNALNNFWSLFKNKDEQTAYGFITRLSRLLRTTLEHADHSTITLNEEIAFVRNFLELESICHGEKFNYHIEVDPGINSKLRVIPMCVQTHVENALKHGIKPKSTSGTLQVIIQNDVRNVLVMVEDDGIGREQAGRMHTSSTGIGLKIQQQMIEFYNSRNNEKIGLEIIDLHKPVYPTSGTRVEIRIPLDYSYLLN